MSEHFARRAADELQRGLGRRTFFRAATAVAAAGAVTGTGAGAASAAVPMGAQHPKGGRPGFRGSVLQPGKGRIPGDHYLPSDVDSVLWGYVPSVDAEPSLRMRSGRTVTIDAVSHEGILEDQGRDPVEFFGAQGVSRARVLDDAVEIARDYDRTERDFDRDGPHVVTGPVFVEEARPGDVLKIETLHADLRVPYGVVSSRHGKGALPGPARGGPVADILVEDVLPTVGTDGRSTGNPQEYGNVSTFTPVEHGQGVMAGGAVRFPLRPFMGMMGVAYQQGSGPTDDLLNSIPPTLGGGNIDIRHLGVGSTFYLPVQTDGACSTWGTRTWPWATARWRSPRWRARCAARSGSRSARPGRGTRPPWPTPTRSRRRTSTGSRSGSPTRTARPAGGRTPISTWRCAGPCSTPSTSSSRTRAWSAPWPTPTSRPPRTSPSPRWWTAPWGCTG